MKVRCDNKAAIAISHNPIYHDTMKHVKIDRHFIKEKTYKGIINVNYISTSARTTNILTKALFKPISKILYRATRGKVQTTMIFLFLFFYLLIFSVVIVSSI